MQPGVICFISGGGVLFSDFGAMRSKRINCVELAHALCTAGELLTWRATAGMFRYLSAITSILHTPIKPISISRLHCAFGEWSDLFIVPQ
jgi:hypothetical protein